ncbi:MAG: penicillin-binding protein 2 [Patescibacteria group bacterium]|nr:penicillin-binding protein 2 [Patescibacteria group bacterium]MDW8279668.1 penicillin-binding protein 2 [bacterium]
MKDDIFFEDALSDEWSKDFDIAEVEFSNKPFFYILIFISFFILIFFIRIIFLNFFSDNEFISRAEINSGKKELILPPRGIIYDRNGKILAENKLSYEALLDINEFIKNDNLKDITLKNIKSILGIDETDVLNLINEKMSLNLTSPIVLKSNLSSDELIKLNTLNLKTIKIQNNYLRFYPDGEIFSSVIGYVGLPSKEDLEYRPYLTNQIFTGKAGIEFQYDKDLVGSPGIILNKRDALGKILLSQKIQDPQPGKNLTLTIDAEFQKFIFNKTKEHLELLGRKAGGVIVINPQNGEVLSMISFPTYDNNIFVNYNKDQILKILNNKDLPLFNRIISGKYAPGSTIKPLVGIAALAENIISPTKTIFSPGYLDVPNPYNPDQPNRFLDWRYQGNVNLYSAIAQSSNVYFYEVGGGFGDIRGLGIYKLIEWWKKFGLGSKTQIDLPGETDGFLPTPEWHKKTFKKPWLLGNTYNVSIGQGDLGISPIQLINYIGAIANDGKLLRPHLLKNDQIQILNDLSYLKNEINEVKKGMVQTVTSPLGSAYLLVDLPISIAGKTGTAQIQQNKAENAFFVGFAPVENPQIAVLVFVENAKQGSLNALPIAKEIFRWFYENRIKK